jgi:hypothetical protein
LGITRVATVDRRHFTVVLPKHVGSFALLPDPLNGRRSDPQGHPKIQLNGRCALTEVVDWRRGESGSAGVAPT